MTLEPPAEEKQKGVRLLIRTTGLFVAGAWGLSIPVFVYIIVRGIITGHNSQWLSLFILFPLLLAIILVQAGYRMYRNIDLTGVSNFAFFVAYLGTMTVRYFLPLTLWHRKLLLIGAFFVLYLLIKEYLLGKLGLDKKDDSRTPLDDNPEFPEKSPAVEL